MWIIAQEIISLLVYQLKAVVDIYKLIDTTWTRSTQSCGPIFLQAGLPETHQKATVNIYAERNENEKNTSYPYIEIIMKQNHKCKYFN